MTYKFLLSVILSLCLFTVASGQDRAIDSLRAILNKEETDSNRVKIMNDLSWEYRVKGDMKEAMRLASEGLDLSNEAGYLQGQATSYNSISLIYADQANYPKAVEYCKKTLDIAKELNNRQQMASSYNNMGVIYSIQNDHSKATECFIEALKIFDQLGNRNSVAALNNNIGIIFFDQQKYPEALEYYKKALETRTQLKDAYGVGSAYLNIGEVHLALKHFDEALEQYRKAFGQYTSINSKLGLATCSNSIGSLYAALASEPDSIKRLFAQRLYAGKGMLPDITRINEALLDSALHWRMNALQLSYETGKKLTRTYSLNGIGDVMKQKRKYAQAVSFYKLAAALSDSINAKESLLNACSGLSQSYEGMSRHDSALFWFRESIRVRDTLFSAEKQVQFARQEARMAYDKEMAVVAEQRKQQQLITWSVAGGLGMMFLFSMVVVGRLRVTGKQKRTIEQQKRLVDEKNKDILDSINYAKRIQDALLKEADSASGHLPAHFIFNQPKDIVSGDFYWSLEKQGYWYLAAADCTGHGVPGALMSMLGMAFLNEINAAGTLYTPAEILDRLRDKVVMELKQSGREGGSKDGMDISLIRLNLATRQLHWAGANNPVYVVQSLAHSAPSENCRVHAETGASLHELKGDKQPIGFHHQQKSFTDHTLQLHAGDSIYLFTDGYADQFGGEKGKKFKYSQLKDLLLSIHQKPVMEQREIVRKTFRFWQGEYEQVDDVCIIGVKV